MAPQVACTKLSLLASSSIGFVLGALFYSRWQVAVESAQVIGGRVAYPPENAFYLYHETAWTILHHFLAAPLALGATERTLSILLSGIVGAVSFLALNACALALSGKPWAALLAPLYAFALFADSSMYGLIYPVFIMGTEHTYGVLGRSLALLALSLLALDRKRTAFFLLGLAPAVHLTWGAFAIGVAAISLIVERSRIKHVTRSIGPAFATGAALSTASFLYQLSRRQGLPDVDPELAGQYLDAFLAHWDYHRRVVSLNAPGVYLAIAVLILSIYSYTRARIDDPKAVAMQRILILLSAFGLAGCLLHMAPDMLPKIIAVAMPGRFINLAIFAFPAVMLGLLARHADRASVRILLALHLLYPLWNWTFMHYLSSDKYGWGLAHWKEFIACAVVFLLLTEFGARLKIPNRVDQFSENFAPNFIRALSVIMLIGVLVAGRANDKALFITPSDEVLETAAAAEGMLISSGAMQFIQLRTGRPILLNVGGLDQINMTPDSGPEMAHVLDAVYGIDLLNPPQEIRERRPGALTPDSSRELFESRTRDDWAQIAREFGASQVLVYAEWNLQLPLLKQNNRYALYELPREGLDTP